MANIQNKFSEYTKLIQAKLPYWFKEMRTNNDSIGAQFLSVFGLAIEDIMFIVDYAYDQNNILKADTNQISNIYKAFLPIQISKNDTIKVHVGGSTYIQADNLNDFFIPTGYEYLYKENSYNEDGIYYTYNNNNLEQVKFYNMFIIDYDKRIVYVKYNHNEPYTNITINDVSYNLELYNHNIWNFFDEFGLLLGLQRLPLENNTDYKERILDIFIHKANATSSGLINGIARELGLRKTKIWTNNPSDFIINDRMVVINSIEVDGILVDETLITIRNSDNSIIIKGDTNYTGINRTISYVIGFNIHELHNKNDYILQNRIDLPTKLLVSYIIDTVNTNAPIFWNNFIWDETTWDNITDYINNNPSMFDAKFITDNMDSFIDKGYICDDDLCCDELILVSIEDLWQDKFPLCSEDILCDDEILVGSLEPEPEELICDDVDNNISYSLFEDSGLACDEDLYILDDTDNYDTFCAEDLICSEYTFIVDSITEDDLDILGLICSETLLCSEYMYLPNYIDNL